MGAGVELLTVSLVVVGVSVVFEEVSSRHARVTPRWGRVAQRVGVAFAIAAAWKWVGWWTAPILVIGPWVVFAVLWMIRGAMGHEFNDERIDP